MAAAAGDDDLKRVEEGRRNALPECEATTWNVRDVVHAVDRINRELVEQAVLDHAPAAALVLFGGLEDEVHGAAERFCTRKLRGSAKQHRRVAVMAAPVHLAGDRRLVRMVSKLEDVERVHIGTQSDARAV